MNLTVHDFIIAMKGPCAVAPRTEHLVLRDAEDEVEFRGPVDLNVSVEVQNEFKPQEGVKANGTRQATASLYSYDVKIPAGYRWAFSLRNFHAQLQRVPGFFVAIRLGACGPQACAPDLPCDFAVRHLPDCGHIFPTVCEPCGDAPIRVPATHGSGSTVIPAQGGCIRPRFFNGMFITREDMETELKYFRIKNNLQRRADGQGVVWGLGLSLDANAICVHPGYAVDCCGNDLTVTCVYKVGVVELLADHAICRRRHGQHECFSLLLEYVECPEEPRPVHGDPCSPGPAGCEMSRVRETVRLRLVPRRDYCPEGPIARFLKKIHEHSREKTDCPPYEREKCEPWPCLTDQCCGDQPLFECVPPWCHGDPDKPGRANDPKAILLAIVYALLAGTIAREDDESNEENVRNCAKLFRSVVRLCDIECAEKGELDKCAVEVQQLLADWCCSLLYPGPCCEGDLHGVVIGCAVVCGDAIVRIDPWDGRRWVMHYPLMAYWGEQFGMVPQDILASRLFDMICCFAKLERPSCESLCADRHDKDGIEYGCGRATLRVGRRRNGNGGLEGTSRTNVTRTQTVGLFEFARYVLAAMIEGGGPFEGPMVEMQLEGFPDCALLLPDLTASAGARPAAVSGQSAPQPAPAVPEGEWTTSLVREALDAARVRRAYRSIPLIRAFTMRLAVGLIRSIPVAALTPPAELVIVLEENGVVVLGDLLDRDLDELVDGLAEPGHAGLLADLIQRGEARVATATEVIVEGVKSAADQHNAASATAFAASESARAALAGALSQRLSLPEETVARHITEALR